MNFSDPASQLVGLGLKAISTAAIGGAIAGKFVIKGVAKGGGKLTKLANQKIKAVAGKDPYFVKKVEALQKRGPIAIFAVPKECVDAFREANMGMEKGLNVFYHTSPNVDRQGLVEIIVNEDQLAVVQRIFQRAELTLLEDDRTLKKDKAPEDRSSGSPSGAISKAYASFRQTNQDRPSVRSELENIQHNASPQKEKKKGEKMALFNNRKGR